MPTTSPIKLALVAAVLLGMPLMADAQCVDSCLCCCSEHFLDLSTAHARLQLVLRGPHDEGDGSSGRGPAHGLDERHKRLIVAIEEIGQHVEQHDVRV